MLSRRPTERLDPHVKRVAIVIVLGMIMSILDTTIVNVALDSLSRDLHTSLSDIQWVVSAYLLALAAVIPLSAWAVRRYSAYRVYMQALVLFTLGLGPVWPGDHVRAAHRVPGLAGARRWPARPGRSDDPGQRVRPGQPAPGDERHRGSDGPGARVRPDLGRVPSAKRELARHLLDQRSHRHRHRAWWRCGCCPETSGDKASAGPLDWPGLLLAGLGTVGITYGLSQSATAGSFTSMSVIVPVVLGAVLIVVFVLRSRIISHPLLDLRLYAIRAYSAASVVMFCMGAALFGAMILLPLYFQVARGQDAITTGLLLIPQGVGASIGMNRSAVATRRFGAGLTSLCGVLIMVCATIPFLFVGATTPYALDRRRPWWCGAWAWAWRLCRP